MELIILTRTGDLFLNRDPTNGLISGTTLGDITTISSFNSYNELVNFSTLFETTELYVVNYIRDKLGRIEQKTEKINDVTDIFNYEYDSLGQLKNVKKTMLLSLHILMIVMVTD